MNLSEHTLVELKAKVRNLDSIRSRLLALNALHIGTFRQTDSYFDVPKGRLKLRQSDNGKETQLIYYERENTSRPKRSKVFVAEIPKSASFSALL
nr:CYTH domain-containing protein [Candidatus Bathyarchaeota archaeon]NIV44815.1 CYTH domain-containing protein [Candidatus Bathyarchaeota archaeon]